MYIAGHPSARSGARYVVTQEGNIGGVLGP